MSESIPVRSHWTRTNVTSLIALAVFILWLSWWFYNRSGYVHVSDARVSATMVSLSSRIPGWIADFPGEEGYLVKKGDVLVQIDARDATLQLDGIEASLNNIDIELDRAKTEYELHKKQVTSKLRASQAHLKATRSALSEAEIVLSKAKRDFRRSESLLADNMVSIETHENRQSSLQELEHTYQQRIAEFEVAEAELLLADASLGELDVLMANQAMNRGKRKELEVERDRLANVIADHTIVSPIDGIIDETFANSGEYVYPGQRILMIHDPDTLWIKANIKETDIRNIQEGLQVTVDVDAYPDQSFSGKVTRIGSAATSQFALLPSPNPSGNFTKVTQRLEVQVALDQHYEQLRPGMMVELAIKIGPKDTVIAAVTP
jgi:membrane fusion protein (multidrug efflux system)